MAKSGEQTDQRTVQLLRIFLSSPGDVAEERQVALQLIDSVLPKLPALRGWLAFEPIAWDDPAAPIALLANETPQESVSAARPRPATCDIVIVILWARMGTPLPDDIRKADGEPYLSGTEWEFEDAINAPEPKPAVFVYRRSEEPKIGLRDPKKKEKEEQFERVDAFFAGLAAKRRGVNEYETPEAFALLLRKHLEDHLVRRLRSNGEDQPPPSETGAEIPPAYLASLKRTLARVDLLGAQQGRSVTLDNVYVPAMTRMAPRHPSEQVGENAMPRQAEEDRLRTLLERLDSESLYVPAPAGAGKSTFCRWAALQSIDGIGELGYPVAAPDEYAEPPPTNLRDRLPLLVPLREFAPGMRCGRGAQTWCRAELEGALAGWVDRSPSATDPALPGLTGAHLRAHLKAGSAFLLLDGLDEVAVGETRDGQTVYPRALLLSGLADALPVWLEAGNRVLLTSRPYGLDQVQLQRLGLPLAELEPLPDPLQDLFVHRWFDTLGKPEKIDDLVATIHSRDDLAPLVDNPMLLTAICVLYDNGGQLPDDRYELYKNIVSGVLHNRYPGEARERNPIERRLEAIALVMHEGDAGAPRATPAAEVSWDEIERSLARFARLNPAYETDQVEVAARREELLNRSGLLLPRSGDRAAFYHLSVQEFLAAQRLNRAADDLERVFRDRRGVAEWRSTLLFLFAAQIASRDAGWGIRLLARLLEDQDRTAVRANPLAAAFVAEAIEFCLTKSYAVPDSLADRFRRLAVDAIEDEVELKSRLTIGLCLGRLDDPRIKGLRDPEASVEVPAGSYPFGDDEARRIEIASPFRIGRYPVTNDQYRAFIDAGGYAEKRWWSEAGWAWREKEQVSEPALWRSRRWSGPNQPVVGVSYWEAEACCAWAGGRLPTEEEWEAAARGPEGLIYPWGNDWEDGVCNTRESRLGVTSPVGLFPRSRQRELGIEDLAGNVWEWCASLYDPTRNPDARVLRGGSWAAVRGRARSAGRNGYHPGFRFNYIGFRVVFLSPIFGH